jgi:thiamine biosynthesis lipoprotein
VPSTKSNPKLLRSSWQFDAIGTRWSIDTPDDLPAVLKDEITKRVETFDQTYSRFRDDSLISRIAKKAGTYTFPDDVVGMLGLYRKLYDATDGAMTPLVGDGLSALGYDKDYSFKKTGQKTAPQWDATMTWDGPRVTTTYPVILDFGAIGKGYLVDLVGEILQQHNVTDYVVDAGGDMRHRGSDTQTVGLENPFDASMVIGAVPLQNASLCGSATNRRRWGNDLHHVIDGRTGLPVTEIAATWVVASTTALADALATALFFVTADKLVGIGDFQFVRMYYDGRIEHSDDFVGELFI